MVVAEREGEGAIDLMGHRWGKSSLSHGSLGPSTLVASRKLEYIRQVNTAAFAPSLREHAT